MSGNFVIIGRFGAPFGIKGEIKVNSFSDPIEAIIDYDPWYIETDEGWQELDLESCRHQGNFIIAKINDIDDRDEVRRYTNTHIAVGRAQLPDTEEDEYYWNDLQGLAVRTQHNEVLGTVKEVFSNGAHDILVIEGEKRHLIPFIWDHFIQTVSLEQGEIIVDWNPQEI